MGMKNILEKSTTSKTNLFFFQTVYKGLMLELYRNINFRIRKMKFCVSDRFINMLKICFILVNILFNFISAPE